MNIIYRNFFRLLRAGAFSTEESIEPMSAWKWRRLVALADTAAITPIISDGAEACRGQFFMQLPADSQEHLSESIAEAGRRFAEAEADVSQLLMAQSSQLMRPIMPYPWTALLRYPNPAHHPLPELAVYFPFETQGRKADEWAKAEAAQTQEGRHSLRYGWRSLSVEHRHRLVQLDNRLNNHSLQDIIERERLEGGTDSIVIGGEHVETPSPTLDLLVALLTIVRTSLREGILLWQVCDVGMLLRSEGHRMDFVKLQSWLERLHFMRLAQHVGAILTLLLGFHADELPFLPSIPNAEAEALADELLVGKQKNTRLRRMLTGEGLSSMVARVTHSIGNVEE